MNFFISGKIYCIERDVTNVVNVSSFAAQPLIVWKLKSTIDREDTRLKGNGKTPKETRKTREYTSVRSKIDTRFDDSKHH